MLLFIDFRWLDFIDIFLVAALIYQLYHIVKGTVAIRIFIGILSIYFFWKLVEALQMDLLSEILGQFIGVGVIALIIVFQQELRRFLLLVGTTGFRDLPIAKRLFSWKTKERQSINIDEIVVACEHMSSSLTGALIVLERTSSLAFISSTGDKVDSELSARMLENIFFKNSPMHDGAVVITDNRINATRCVLPVTENSSFPASLGMRHRAAVGITEDTDALSIVVSEQTGEMSLASNGKLHNVLTDTKLKELILMHFS